MKGIHKTTFKDQIQQILTERMLSGELQPGEQLKELSLAREFGTSQAPVREALRALESSGYLEHRLNKGTVVRSMHIQEITESLKVKEALEIEALLDGFTILQENLIDWQSLESNTKKALDQNDFISFFHLYTQFHRMIIESCGNSVILSIWEPLSSRLEIALRQAVNSEELLMSDMLHPDLILSVEKGNCHESERQLRIHYQLWYKNLTQ